MSTTRDRRELNSSSQLKEGSTAHPDQALSDQLLLDFLLIPTALQFCSSPLGSLEVPGGNNLEIPGTAEPWVLLGLSGGVCRIPAAFWNPGTFLRTALVIKSASASLRCVLKAALWKPLRTH